MAPFSFQYIYAKTGKLSYTRIIELGEGEDYLMIEDDQSGGKIAERVIDFEKQSTAGRVNANQNNADQGLAKLVLTLVELLRRVMEHEALRRIDGGTLTEREIEEMGETFLKLDNKMIEMREIFGLKEEDLNLELGPLGNLM